MIFVIVPVVPLLAEVHDPNKLPYSRVPQRTPIGLLSSSYIATFSLRLPLCQSSLSPQSCCYENLSQWTLAPKIMINDVFDTNFITLEVPIKDTLQIFENILIFVSRVLIFSQS
jgi:hypothetical protein